MLLVALLLLVGLTSGSVPAQPARAAGAVGIVVRHGDGRLLYAYVPLSGESITGAEALEKASFALNVAASSLGTAVCAIDGEGCIAPKEDCFCKSYGDPSFYWHYYLRAPDGSWRAANSGANSRVLHDGDVDGWVWTSSRDPNLPIVTLPEIAAAVQAARATPTPPLTLVPTEAGSPTAAPTIVASAATTTDTAPRAAVIAPSGSATPIQPAPQQEHGPTNGAIGGFVAVAAVMLLLLALVPRGARRAKRGRDG